MTNTSFLIQNIAELFSMKTVMTGGTEKNTPFNNSYTNKSNITLMVLFGTLIAILIKGLIVYLLYNFMVPKIMYSLSENKSLEIIESNFKTLSYSESILLVILTNTLFYF